MGKKMSLCVVLLIAAAICLAACGSPLAKWPGYAGTMEEYEYLHTEERDRLWEEDILSLAENFLKYHPLLVDKETRVFVEDEEAEWVNQFDETLYTDFLADINQLISNIPELSDNQILFEVQKAVAALGDAHSQVEIPQDTFFPFVFVPFKTDGGVELYAVSVLAEDEQLLYSKLVSINGIPVEEVLERMEPYVSYENDGWFLHMCTSDTGREWIVQRNMLEATGVIAPEGETVDFAFLTADGQQVVEAFSAVTWEVYLAAERANRGPYKTYSLLYKDWVAKNYWYEMLPEDDMLYIRIARFSEDKQPLSKMCTQLIKLIGDSGGIDKVVVDLRNNVGGLKIDGYDRLIRILNMDEINSVYVLTDSGTYSRAVMMAHQIREDVEDSVLVGTPAGEGSSMFAHMSQSYQTMPNCGLNYYIGMQRDIVDSEEEYDALMPDVLVYPTLDDYKQGIDTILEAVKEK